MSGGFVVEHIPGRGCVPHEFSRKGPEPIASDERKPNFCCLTAAGRGIVKHTEKRGPSPHTRDPPRSGGPRAKREGKMRQTEGEGERKGMLVDDVYTARPSRWPSFLEGAPAYIIRHCRDRRQIGRRVYSRPGSLVSSYQTLESCKL